MGVLLPEEGEDINSSLERTELKSRLEEAGYEAAMYFASVAESVVVSCLELFQQIAPPFKV